MSNGGRPLNTGSREESCKLESLSHESCSRTQLNIGVGPFGHGAHGCPVGVSFRVKLRGVATGRQAPMGEEDHGAGQGSWGIEEEGLARYEGPTSKKGGLPDRVYPQKYTGEGRALQFLQKRSASHGE